MPFTLQTLILFALCQGVYFRSLFIVIVIDSDQVVTKSVKINSFFGNTIIVKVASNYVVYC